MKLILIRHGDPNYETDSLTDCGIAEAKALAERMVNVNAVAYYVSPLGRAQKTASYTLNRLGKTAETCSWLREFDCLIEKPHSDWNPGIPWDWMPGDWMVRPAFYEKDGWYREPEMEAVQMKAAYQEVTDKLDELLAGYGYERSGLFYRAVRPNHDTVVFFCHFGLESVLLSHLLNVSPMVLWHGTCSLTTGVTTVVTEERMQGVASWRMLTFGDVSHLIAAGLSPSFSARFCECYTDLDRH